MLETYLNSFVISRRITTNFPTAILYIAYGCKLMLTRYGEHYVLLNIDLVEQTNEGPQK